MKLLLLLLVLGIVGFSAAEKKRYDNYQVHLLVPKTERQLQALQHLQHVPGFDFWTEPRGINRPARLMVPPSKNKFFQRFLKNTGIVDEIQIKNVQTLIAEEEKRLSLRSNKAEGFEWTEYHDLDVVYAWLDELAQTYDNVKVVVGGQTYEGREIRGIEINNGDNLPGVVIESGIHAREWITVAGSSWVVNEILKDSADPIWRQFNYLYFPSVNPDGYTYTFSEDRLWRKTRRPYKWGLITCYGADANRNYGSHWSEGGSSNNPCTETYAGPEAFSEVETKSLSDYLTSQAQIRNNQVYVAYHSYSQLLMFPWGYTDEHIPEHETYQRIGDAAAASLKAVHGTEFTVGNIYEVIYQTSGTSTEWYYDKLKPTLSYVYEMRDTGRYGFELPPDQIIPVGEEHLASLRTILEEYQKLGSN